MKLAVITKYDNFFDLAKEYLKDAYTEIVNIPLDKFNAADRQFSGASMIIFDLSCPDEDIPDEVFNSLEAEYGPVKLMSESHVSNMSETEAIVYFRKIEKEIILQLELKGIEQKKIVTKHGDIDVWILCSSSGGPSTISDILQKTDGKKNCCIFIAQHIHAKALAALSATISLHTEGWDVLLSSSQPRIGPGRIIICDPRTLLSIENKITCKVKKIEQTENVIYPSINDIITNIVEGYPNDKINIAVLTGMGNDGSSAIKRIGEKVSKIIIQDIDTCTVQSMPLSAKSAYSKSVYMHPEKIGQMISGA